MTGAEVAVFRDFCENTVNCGAIFFEMNIPISTTTDALKVRFDSTDLPVYEYIAVDLWRVSAGLEAIYVAPVNPNVQELLAVYPLADLLATQAYLTPTPAWNYFFIQYHADFGMAF